MEITHGSDMNKADGIHRTYRIYKSQKSYKSYL
jgi:hypothetical protein